MKKTAVVLFNLGGPDSTKAIKPFLFNLFNDRAIITLPQPFRYLLAKLISGRRAKVAKDIYGQIGGRSPILDLTQSQMQALSEKLGKDFKVFICMRYWHPMTREVARAVRNYVPQEVILLPLYPQFSTTTTGSSFSQWDDYAKKVGLTAPTRRICCYPAQEDFIDAHVKPIREGLKKISGDYRILFSAHGLPEKFIQMGDPYQWQIEQSVAAIVEKLAIENLDHRICYQSRVGKLKWIEPYTEDELCIAGAENKSIVIVPVAFVSEHSETLVELDIEYKKIALEAGAPDYMRVPALAVQDGFIDALARLCTTVPADKTIACHTGGRICPNQFTQCPQKGAA